MGCKCFGVTTSQHLRFVGVYNKTMSELAKTSRINKALRAWIPLGILATLMCGLVYGAAQQVYRQGANDPQIEIAEDTAHSLELSGQSAGIVPTEQVDLRRSLSPFIMTFNASGELQASSAILDGNKPLPPSGVLDYAKIRGQNKFTWQPANGVREAAVIQRIGGSQPGFVLVGRSLSQVESREEQLLIRVALAWLVSLVSTLLAVYWLQK